MAGWSGEFGSRSGSPFTGLPLWTGTWTEATVTATTTKTSTKTEATATGSPTSKASTGISELPSSYTSSATSNSIFPSYPLSSLSSLPAESAGPNAEDLASHKTLNIGVIGAIIGVVVGAMICLIVFLWRRKRRQRAVRHSMAPFDVRDCSSAVTKATITGTAQRPEEITILPTPREEKQPSSVLPLNRIHSAVTTRPMTTQLLSPQISSGLTTTVEPQLTGTAAPSARFQRHIQEQNAASAGPVDDRFSPMFIHMVADAVAQRMGTAHLNPLLGFEGSPTSQPPPYYDETRPTSTIIGEMVPSESGA